MAVHHIRIGGVPEHYNLPVHLAIKNDNFKEHGIQIDWIDFPGGTGEMTRALRADECDLCILLTEGIVTDIIKGNPSKIISGYVKTPLTWGIHTQQDNPLDNHADIFDRNFAVSRKGSGSHLMPIVDGLMRNEVIEDAQFKEVKNLEGAIISLKAKETEIFYWEKFTTKPHLERGQMKKIDDFVSPWPCFMIAATNKIIDSEPEIVSKILKIIQSTCRSFMQNKDAIQLVNVNYNISKKDAERWYHATEWAVDGWVSNKMLEGVLYILKEADIVDEEATLDGLIWKRNEAK